MEQGPDVRVLKSPPVRAALGQILALYLRLVLKVQYRQEIMGRENLRLLAGDEPLIVVFWHETLPTMQVLWHEAMALGMVRPAAALVSRHRDGRMVGQVLQTLGISTVEGSSSKGGAAGLQELVKLLKSGVNIALTPDGPRGPARRAAAGVVALAGLSGMRILPCGVAASRFFTLRKSWDQMRVPLPFGRVRLVCGAPIQVPRESWREMLPQVEAALNAAQQQAMQ